MTDQVHIIVNDFDVKIERVFASAKDAAKYQYELNGWDEEGNELEGPYSTYIFDVE